MTKLNFRELEIVQAILIEGNVSLASRRLNVTQPAVSMMLRQAEERLGFPLFERNGNRLTPTEQLGELVPLLSSIFSQMNDLSDQVTRVRSGQVGSLRIGATAALSGAFVDNALYLFQVRAPQVRVSLQVGPNLAVVSGIEQGRFDIGITYSRSDAPDTSHKIIGSTVAVCYLPNAHPLASKPEIHPEDLLDERLISYRADTVFGRKLSGAFETRGSRFAPVIETSAQSAISLAAKNAGIALVDRLVTKLADPDKLTVRPFHPEVKTELYLIRSATGTSRSATLFEQSVLESLQTS